MSSPCIVLSKEANNEIEKRYKDFSTNLFSTSNDGTMFVNIFSESFQEENKKYKDLLLKDLKLKKKVLNKWEWMNKSMEFLNDRKENLVKIQWKSKENIDI